MVKVEVVKDNKVPFRPEPEELPEIDFELTKNDRYASLDFVKKEAGKVKKNVHQGSSPKNENKLITAKADNVGSKPERIR